MKLIRSNHRQHIIDQFDDGRVCASPYFMARNYVDKVLSPIGDCSTGRIRDMPYRWNFERRCGFLVMCGMICIAVSGPSYGAGNGYDGVYTGTRVPTDSPPKPSCGAEENVSVTIAGDVLAFTDSEFKNLKIGFHPSEEGDFDIAYDAVSNKYLAIQGRVTGDVIEAYTFNMYTKCSYDWHLTKQHRKP